MEALRDRLGALLGESFQGLKVEMADEFAYDDPVDGSRAEKQGIRIAFSDGSRIVFRLSGTGTVGATLRVYLERYEPGPGELDRPVEDALAPVMAAAGEIAEIREFTGRDAPDVRT